MRRLLITYFVGLGLVVTYLVSPLATAWFIREAIYTGQSEYLARKIEWPVVKDTLKASLTRYALRTNGIETSAKSGSTMEPAPPPGLWQRIKAAYSRKVVTSMVDTMMTPEGLPKLLQYRRNYNETFRGAADEVTTLPLRERLARAWSRVVRAEFVSPTRFAVEMQDRYDASRAYAGILEFNGLEWRLVSLELVGERKPGIVARAWSAVKQAALPGP